MPNESLSETNENELIKLSDNKIIVGWHEWCALPELGIPAVKAKIDTGAKTSSLHAFDIKATPTENHERVHFSIHPIQGNNKIVVRCHAAIIDERYIMSSNGHKELRCVISTKLQLGDLAWDIELTLSDRDPLRFRMLLGREALKKNVIINPARTLYQGSVKKSELRALYDFKK